MQVSINIKGYHGVDEFDQAVSVDDKALDAVLFDFNPSSNPKVATIKALHAAVIQVMNDLRDDPTSTPAQKRSASIAVTELEGTQMRAVKALFAKA